MGDEGIRFTWQGRKFVARPTTDKMKERYGVWAFNQMLRNARARMDWNQYRTFENRLAAKPPEWTSLADESILAILNTAAGARQFIRITLDLSEDANDESYMSDEELDQLIAEETDTGCAFMRAMKQIGELSDPKAQKGGVGSPRPEAASEPTPPSAEATSDSQPKQSAA